MRHPYKRTFRIEGHMSIPCSTCNERFFGLAALPYGSAFTICFTAVEGFEDSYTARKDGGIRRAGHRHRGSACSCVRVIGQPRWTGTRHRESQKTTPSSRRGGVFAVESREAGSSHPHITPPSPQHQLSHPHREPLPPQPQTRLQPCPES